MSNSKWSITLQIYRQKGQEPAHFDEFKLEVNPDEYVLDCVERIWAHHDRTLVFRHACHHSTCGACGMRVNGVEKLTCITPVRDMVQDGGVMRVEPMRNFPVVSDLAVDMTSLYSRMEMVGQRTILPVEEAGMPRGSGAGPDGSENQYLRLSDCIECGLCISACPISTTSPEYLGPAVLAGAQQTGLKDNPRLLDIIDSENGVWRCHGVYECTAVCPSFVEPGWRIMDLRKQVITERVRRLFHPSAEPQAEIVKS
ncbi:MAG TPA: 2Fe-2S iron-sulfur cluster-binding protein [Anaerolineales bacterium]